MGWIDAAHKHGVKVLGTIITEWKAGKELCKELLSSQDNMDLFVKKCVEIAQSEGFDGWLFNIENPIDFGEDSLAKLAQVVENLTKEMRKVNANSEVIWYDSVTCEGKLDWQNELNAKNKMFFDACDGIFLNYTWKVEEGKDSLKNSIKTLANDLSRKTDIYVGIDVFGRGCFGGGEFNCHVALEAIRSNGLSAAIFAPGWTHEIPFRNQTLETEFLIRESAFWNLLKPFLYFYGPKFTIEKSGYIGNYIFKRN